MTQITGGPDNQAIMAPVDGPPATSCVVTKPGPAQAPSRQPQGLQTLATTVPPPAAVGRMLPATQGSVQHLHRPAMHGGAASMTSRT